jgi:hypothetical protein
MDRGVPRPLFSSRYLLFLLFESSVWRASIHFLRDIVGQWSQS